MSPRRSSRARINPPPPPAAPKHTTSSNSSNSSGRAERSTRSQDKNGSPRRSDPRSQSLDDAGANEPTKPPPRRTRSGHDEIREPPPVKDEVEDEDVDEEEITRCVCGQIEYPGLPAPTTELLKQQDGRSSASPTIVNEELGNMFIQCDVCQVWQHGGCVGILDDASAPDEYFCEGCRRDLHKLGTAPNG